MKLKYVLIIAAFIAAWKWQNEILGFLMPIKKSDPMSKEDIIAEIKLKHKELFEEYAASVGKKVSELDMSFYYSLSKEKLQELRGMSADEMRTKISEYLAQMMQANTTKKVIL